jgi:hypothetical protein
VGRRSRYPEEFGGGWSGGRSTPHRPRCSSPASWAFTTRAKQAGLLPSMGSIGDCYDNAVINSFWSRLQVELLDRLRRHTRLELANEMFDDLEIFHNRCRRHPAVGWLTHRVREPALNRRGMKFQQSDSMERGAHQGIRLTGVTSGHGEQQGGAEGVTGRSPG